MPEKKRKRLRLQNFDYTKNGAYFVTVCTHNKADLFGPVGEKTDASAMIEQVFEETLREYPQMECCRYVVMPNHFHALLVIENMTDFSAQSVAHFMQAFKSKTTVCYIRLVKAGKAAPFAGKLWQRSYYDHIIRNEQDFQEVWKYIEENPLRWQLKRQTEL